MDADSQPFLSIKALLVLGLAFLLLILSIVCGYLFFAEATPSPGAMMVSGSFLFIASAWFAIYGILIDTRLAASFAFPDAVNLAASRTQDLRRDYNRAVSSVEDMQAVVVRESEKVDALFAEMRRTNSLVVEAESRLADEISARRDAQSQLQQWQDRALDVVRGIERLVSMDGVSPDYAAGAEKVLASLERQLGPVGLTVVRPKPGDPFEDMLHQAAGEEAHPTLQPGSIARGISWGLVAGDQRERARVVLVAGRALSAKMTCDDHDRGIAEHKGGVGCV